MHCEACRAGRGGILLLSARGSVIEGLTLGSEFARCCVFFGIPYQYQLSVLSKAKLEYIQKVKKIDKTDYAMFDAMRIPSGLIARTLHSRQDCAVTIFADKVSARCLLS